MGKESSNFLTACKIEAVSSLGVDWLGGTLDNRFNSSILLFVAGAASLGLGVDLVAKRSSRKESESFIRVGGPHR